MMSNAEVKQSFVCQRLKACRKQKKKSLQSFYRACFIILSSKAYSQSNPCSHN
jgi:hypothetical protein